MKENIILEGKFVRLEEICPKYFAKVIEWRNNPENNRFLNQPFKLTMELEQKWYREKYLNDYTQGLLIAVDKEKNIPFATIGWTNYDRKEKICVAGRLLVGNLQYRGSKKWLETALITNDYLYNILNVDKIYAHIVIENIASYKWHKKWGFNENKNDFKFPEEKIVNGMKQKEYFRTFEQYQIVRRNIEKLLNDFDNL